MSRLGARVTSCLFDETLLFNRLRADEPLVDTANLEALRRKRRALKALAFPYIYGVESEEGRQAAEALSELSRRIIAARCNRREEWMRDAVARRYGVDVAEVHTLVNYVVRDREELERAAEEAAERLTAAIAELADGLASTVTKLGDTWLVELDQPPIYAGVDDGLRTPHRPDNRKVTA